MSAAAEGAATGRRGAGAPAPGYPIRLTAAQAATRLGVDPDTGTPVMSPRAVLAAYRRGDLRGVRLGGKVLFSPDDLDGFLAARVTGGQADRPPDGR